MNRFNGGILKEERNRKNWTQEDLAKKLETDTNTVSRWERGTHYPHPLHRRKLCEIYAKSPEELGFYYEDDPGKHAVVFLSYAMGREDEEEAHAICRHLKKRHIRVVSCKDREENTSNRKQALRNQLHGVQAVIVIASPSAHTSDTIREELELAEELKLPVISYWIAGHFWKDVLPAGQNVVRAIDAIDVRSEYLESGLDALVKRLTLYLPQFSRKGGTLNMLQAQRSRNPYKGLEAFDVSDELYFFGRDPLVSFLIEDMSHTLSSQRGDQPIPRLLPIVGPSGSGKSSLVRAGLLPRLQKPLHELPLSNHWIYCMMRPGSKPLRALKKCLLQHKLEQPGFSEGEEVEQLMQLAVQHAMENEKKIILVVDQFEEAFASFVEEKERKQFIDLLLERCMQIDGPLFLLLTLRLDVYGHVLAYSGNPQLGRLMKRMTRFTEPMCERELRLAIEGPATIPGVQLTFEEGLVAKLLEDVHGQSGAMPLLQFTLEQLFRSRLNSQMTKQVYIDIGGATGALASRAEMLFEHLPDSQKKLVPALFLRLVMPNLGHFALRRVPLADLPKPILPLVDEFTKARLLTTGKEGEIETVEISHEALIHAWPTLAQWIYEASQDSFEWKKELSQRAKEWHEKRRPDLLYRGSRLKNAQILLNTGYLNGMETDFVLAGRRHKHFLQALSAGSIILFALIMTTAGLWVWQLYQEGRYVRVTSSAEFGPGSFYEATVKVANGGVIEIDSSKVRQIFLSKMIEIDKDITIRITDGTSLVKLTSKDGISRIHISKDATVTMNGLALSESQFVSPLSNESGLGFLVNDGTLTLVNCRVENNKAVSGGGIVNRGHLTLLHTLVRENVATNRGGGIWNEGTLEVIKSQILSNEARDGGGIMNLHATLVVIESTISSNRALGGNGGGMSNEGSVVTIEKSTLSDNLTRNGEGRKTSGGAIYDQNGKKPLTLKNCKIFNNQAERDGGGIALYGSEALITSCEINKNMALNGGALAIEVNEYNNRASNLTVRDSHFEGNSATQHGPILYVIEPSVYIGLPPDAVESGVQEASSLLLKDVISVEELNQYCRSKGYSSAFLDDSSTAYGWSCVTFENNHMGVSMTEVCQYFHQESAVIDRAANFHDPMSWQCWYSPVKQ